MFDNIKKKYISTKTILILIAMVFLSIYSYSIIKVVSKKKNPLPEENNKMIIESIHVYKKNEESQEKIGENNNTKEIYGEKFKRMENTSSPSPKQNENIIINTTSDKKKNNNLVVLVEDENENTSPEIYSSKFKNLTHIDNNFISSKQKKSKYSKVFKNLASDPKNKSQIHYKRKQDEIEEGHAFKEALKGNKFNKKETKKNTKINNAIHPLETKKTKKNSFDSSSQKSSKRKKKVTFC